MTSVKRMTPPTAPSMSFSTPLRYAKVLWVSRATDPREQALLGWGRRSRHDKRTSHTSFLHVQRHLPFPLRFPSGRDRESQADRRLPAQSSGSLLREAVGRLRKAS